MRPDEQVTHDTMSHNEDLSLIRRFVAGEAEAFAALYHKYQQPLYAVCRRVLGNEAEAEDALQEAWLDIYAGLQRFRGDAQFLTWAYRITVRQCMEHVKKMKRQDSTMPEPVQPDRQQALVNGIVVQEALDTLPAGSRVVLVLRYFQQLSYQEIAAATGGNIPLVKIRLYRAKQQLKHALGAAVGVALLTFLEQHAAAQALPPFADGYTQLAMHLQRPGALVGRLLPLALPAPGVVVTVLASVALVVGGVGWVNHHLHRNDTFVSPPRSAAVTRRAEERIDLLLAKDARLLRRIDLRANGEPLHQTLAAISQQAGVGISVAPEIASQRIFLKLRDASFARVLSEINTQLDVDWRAVQGGYALAYTPRAREAEAAARRAEQAAAMRDAVANLREIQQLIATRNQANLHMPTAAGGTRDSLERLIAEYSPDPARWKDTSIHSNYACYYLLDDATITKLAAGHEVHRNYQQLSPRQKIVWEKALHESSQKLSTVTMSLALHGDEYGNIGIPISLDNPQGGSEYWSPVNTGQCLYDAWNGRRPTNYIRKELPGILADARAANPMYADPRLKVKLGNKTASSSHEPDYNVLQMVRLIADQTDLQVVADYFTLTDNTMRAFEHELTLEELLAVMDRDFNIAWRLTPDGILYLRHRAGAFLRRTEPPAALVSSLYAAAKTRHTFSLAEMAQLAMLEEPQRNGVYAALHERSGGPTICPMGDFTGDVLNVVNNFRNAFILYGSLTPEQRRQAESPEGLRSTQMSPQQITLAIEDYMGKPTHPEYYTARPFTWSVLYFRDTWANVGKNYQNQVGGFRSFRCTDQPDTTYLPFVMFEFRMFESGMGMTYRAVYNVPMMAEKMKRR